jgi:hypothetical protein
VAAEPLADFYIHDEGAALRRTGGWLILAGFVSFVAGFSTLLFAFTTWSGYEVQGALALLIGGALLGGGLTVVEAGARRGPRLVPVPVRTSPARPPLRPLGSTPPAAPPTRVKVAAWHEPVRSIPASRRF